MYSINSQQFTQTVTEVINKGKKALYLVLKKKPLAVEIYDNLKNEAEERFNKFLENKKPLLMDIKPENPEIFYECFLMRAMIEILKEMLKERKVTLSERDLNLFNYIFKKDFKQSIIPLDYNDEEDEEFTQNINNDNNINNLDFFKIIKDLKK